MPKGSVVGSSSLWIPEDRPRLVDRRHVTDVRWRGNVRVGSPGPGSIGPADLCCRRGPRHAEEPVEVVIGLVHGGSPQPRVTGSEVKMFSPSRSASRRVSSWPRTLFPCGVERRRVGAEPALARRHGDDPAADPALAGQPHLVHPVARALVEPGRRHHGEHALAVPGRDHPLARPRVHAAVGQRGAHHGEVLGGDAAASTAGCTPRSPRRDRSRRVRSCRAGGRCPGCGGSWPAPTRTRRRRAPGDARRSATARPARGPTSPRPCRPGRGSWWRWRPRSPSGSSSGCR